jgi:ABC-2 type transport system ATP-binding protein
MSENNITLRVAGATKRYGDFRAVEDISFDVRAGRVFGFLGPNGAGKTTTIRMIVGITAPLPSAGISSTGNSAIRCWSSRAS